MGILECTHIQSKRFPNTKIYLKQHLLKEKAMREREREGQRLKRIGIERDRVKWREKSKHQETRAENVEIHENIKSKIHEKESISIVTTGYYM